MRSFHNHSLDELRGFGSVRECSKAGCIFWARLTAFWKVVMLTTPQGTNSSLNINILRLGEPEFATIQKHPRGIFTQIEMLWRDRWMQTYSQEAGLPGREVRHKH